jgi:hypothetical protein
MLNLGMSGVPVTGPGRPPRISGGASYNTAARGLPAAGALSPLFILPFGISDAQITPGAGPDSIKAVKDLADMHVRLFPYIYSLAVRQSAEGNPAIQSPLLRYPGGEAWYEAGDQYLLGESLLVVANGSEGNKTRRVRFPPGRWMRLASLKIFRGGEREAPADSRGPLLFLSEGAILPLFEEIFHTFSEAEAESIKTGSPGRDLTLMWISGPSAVFTLYDGTRLSARRVAESIMLKSSGPAERSFTWRVFDCGPPLAVFQNSIRLDESQWDYQERSRVLTIMDVPGPKAEVEVVLKEAIE